MTPRTGRPKLPDKDKKEKLWMYVTKSEREEIESAKKIEDPESKYTLGRWLSEIILRIIRK